MLFGSLTRSRGWIAGLIVLSPLSAVWAQSAAATIGSPNRTTQQTAAATTTTTAPAVATPATTAPADPLMDQIDKAIEVNSHRYLKANYNSPWQIFHGILAYRQGFTLQVGDKRMPAIDWIATADARYHNLPWIVTTPHGAKFHPYSGVPKAFEGHPSQSLALLSESHLPTDFKFKAQGRDVTIGDMLQNSMMEVNTREETTWVLWALINYMPVDKQWVSQSGESWSIERLVQLEVAAHTPTRPCGGNHNLFVLCRARDKYLKTGLPLRGVWLEADQKIKMYAEYARTMQNPDGSFSSNFYKGPGHTTQMDARFNTTGHTLEFLSIALPEKRLKEQWVRNAANILSWELIQTKQASPDPGPLYHSLNALMNYRNRVRPPAAPVEVAQTPAVAPTTPGTVKTETPTVAPALLAPGVVNIAKPAAVDPTAPRLPGTDAPETTGPVSALEPANRR
ncbi:MAG TPA: hypothetical protein VM165_12205 [Planctomycetaceae bacterium]|nr:hypothetical protein [Planctomycetaceae bacterium]